MDGQPCPTSNAQQLRVVQQLLWDVISHHLYPAERDEIRRALGNSLLDENESMFAEAAALADILGDVQLNTSALLARHQLCSNPQRSMAESEIRLLIDRLHSTANTTPYGSAVVRERDPESLLPRSGKRDKAVLDYMTTVAQIAETGGRPPSSAGLPPRPPTALSASASASSRPGTSSRPPTALSASASITLPSPLPRPGTASPNTLNGSRPSTASSAASSAATRYTDAPSVVAGVADKLSVATIEAVRATLQSALLDERAALLEDIEYLQGLLDAEADLQVRAAAPPPSLAELKDYSSRLAAVVAEEEARVEHEVRVSAMFAAADAQASKAGRLRGMVDASRRPTSSGSGGVCAATQSAAGGASSSPGRRSVSSGGTASGGGGASNGSSNVQTLVVHAVGDDETERQQTPPTSQQQPRRSPSLADVSGPTAMLAVPTAAAAAASAVRLAGPAALTAVQRPRSGGAGTADASPSSASSLPPVFPPPAASRPLGAAAGTLPAVRRSPASGASPAAAAAAAGHPRRPDSNGAPKPSSVASSASSSTSPCPPGLSAAGRLRQTSPGRALHASSTAAAAGQGLGNPSGHEASPPGQEHGSHTAHAHAHGRPHPHLHLHRDRSPYVACGIASPSPSSGHGHKTGLIVAGSTAAASSAAPSLGPRGLLQRSGSTDRRSGGGGAPGAVASGSTASSATASRAASGRPSSVIEAPAAAVTLKSVTASPSKAAVAIVAVTPGGAVAARLGAGATSDPSATTAVQPRALLGNKQSVIERLDAEVDEVVKGGVAAILERYNIRPSMSTTPTDPLAMPAAAAAAVARGTARSVQ